MLFNISGKNYRIDEVKVHGKEYLKYSSHHNLILRINIIRCAAINKKTKHTLKNDNNEKFSFTEIFMSGYSLCINRWVTVSLLAAECEHVKGPGWCGGETFTLLGNPAWRSGFSWGRALGASAERWLSKAVIKERAGKS